MFRADWKELLSKVHFTIPLLLYLPIIAWCLWLAPASWASSGLFLGGFFCWTFVEYALHRFFFHWMPPGKIGARLHFKCENLQKIGAFKARGAVNAVFSLPADVAGRGVVTHSSGNHGAALAYAARRRGIPAWVVMPENAPKVKIANVAREGATIRFCAPTVAAREAACAEVQGESGATLIHPFDHAEVMRGNGKWGKTSNSTVTPMAPAPTDVNVTSMPITAPMQPMPPSPATGACRCCWAPWAAWAFSWGQRGSGG